MGQKLFLRFISLLFLFAFVAEVTSEVYNVMNYGADSNGNKDSSQAFSSAWKEACACNESTTFLIPEGKFVVGPVLFAGPCKSNMVDFQVKGVVIAPADLNKFDSDCWISFSYINRLKISGGGTFDGQGATAWPHNQCPKQSQCHLLPANLRFNFINNSIVSQITSLNSKSFHINILGCHNLTLQSVTVTAPKDSPNTDGIHIGLSTEINITQSVIGTGDDCISIGPGSVDVTVFGVTCGPGHGISVGSLGKYKDEVDVDRITVRNCTLKGTTNGVRIKTWPDSPVSSAASNFIFEDIVMDDVQNPIIIDQQYCPFTSCSQKNPSRVKISNVKFNKIRGTTSTKNAVTLMCSEGVPCEGVEIGDIHLQYTGVDGPATWACSSVKASFFGKQIPPTSC